MPDPVVTKKQPSAKGVETELDPEREGKAKISATLSELLADTEAKARLEQAVTSKKREVGLVTSFEPNDKIQRQLQAAVEKLGLPKDSKITVLEGLYEKEDNSGYNREVRAYIRDPKSGDLVVLASLREGAAEAYVSVTDQGRASIQDRMMRQRFNYPETVTAKLDALPPSLAATQWIHPKLPEGVTLKSPPRVYVVIHEAHASKQVLEVGGKEFYEDGVKVNRQVAEILQKLDPKEIYVDGITPELSVGINQTMAVLNDPKSKETVRSLTEMFRTDDPEKLAAMHKTLTDSGANPKLLNALTYLREYYTAKRNYEAEAKEKGTISEAFAGRVRLLPTEGKELVERALQIAEEGGREVKAERAQGKDPFPKDEKGRWIMEFQSGQVAELFDKRENYSLGEFIKSDRAYAVGVWGAAHDFSNEVEAHNSKNPTRPIALVVITPTELSNNYNIVHLPPVPNGQGSTKETPQPK